MIQLPSVSEKEHATILAALRFYQAYFSGSYLFGPSLMEIATNGYTLTPMSGEEIDQLCQRINTEYEEIDL
jgi:hypothetical protein